MPEPRLLISTGGFDRQQCAVPVPRLRDRLARVRAFHDRAGLRVGLAPAGAQCLALRFRADRLRVAGALRAGHGADPGHSFGVAADRQFLWRWRHD